MECEQPEHGDGPAEDYLEFQPGQNTDDGPTELYEDMQATEGNDVAQELYEEPGGWSFDGGTGHSGLRVTYLAWHEGLGSHWEAV